MPPRATCDADRPPHPRAGPGALAQVAPDRLRLVPDRLRRTKRVQSAAQMGPGWLEPSAPATRHRDDRVLVGQACADVRRGAGGKSAVAALVTKVRATSVSRWLLLRA